MKEKWFIEDISPWDMSAESVCLHLSNYKLLSHEEIEKKYGKKISELRWVELEDAEVKAGGASGLLIVDGEKFKLTYAWGGLNSKEDYHIRMNYTVKVEGEDCEKFFRSLGTRIAEVEGVTPCRGSQLNAVTPEDPIFSPFLYTVRPYKERRKKTMWRLRKYFRYQQTVLRSIGIKGFIEWKFNSKWLLLKSLWKERKGVKNA